MEFNWYNLQFSVFFITITSKIESVDQDRLQDRPKKKKLHCVELAACATVYVYTLALASNS